MDNYPSTAFIQKKGNLSSINYYDIKKHEYVVYDFELVKSLRNIFLLKSKADNKTYSFDETTYQDSTSIFDIEVDDADYLFQNNKNKDKSLVLTFHGKKALYRTGEGLFTEFKYDDVEAKKYITILRNRDKYSFAYTNDITGNFSNISEEFNRIEIDKNNSDILYCYSDKFTYVYDVSKQFLILKTSREVEHTLNYFQYDTDYIEYPFIATKGNAQGILSSVVNTKTHEINDMILIDGCDVITYDKESDRPIFYIDKNGKKGIFCGSSFRHKTIEPNYMNVKRLRAGFHGDFYALDILNSKYSSDIVIFGEDTPLETLVKSCSVVDMTNKAIVYSKKFFSQREKFGLVFPKNGFDAVVIPATSTSIKALSHYFYETEEENKKGMYYLEKLIIPKKYKNFNISFSSEYRDLDNASTVYFSLQKEEHSVLARMTYFLYKHTDEIHIKELGEYDDISFFKDIIVCRILGVVYIFNYDHILVGKFSSNVVVSPVGPEAKHIYNIGGTYYEFSNNKLVRLYQDTINLYITTYETDTDVFEVRTFDQPALEEFSDHIDSMEDNLSGEELINYSSDKDSLNGKYPTLTLKRTPKIN